MEMKSTQSNTLKRTLEGFGFISIFCVKRRVLFLRIGVFFVLICLMAAIGTISVIMLRNREIQNFNELFKSSVNQISTSINLSLLAKLDATYALNNIYSFAIRHGYIGVSPNVTLPGFEEIVVSLGDLATSRNIAFDPILNNRTRRGWEAYAKSHVDELNGPQSLKNSSMGWTVADGCWTPGSEPTYSKGYMPGSIFPDLVIPIWQISHINDNAGAVMLDVHSQEGGTEVIDYCIFYRKPGFTDFLQLVQDSNIRPSTILYSPIINLDTDQVIALSDLAFSWDDVLSDQLPTYISGFTCVLSTATQSFTLHIEEGSVKWIGKGDAHDRTFDSFKQSITEYLTVLSSISASDYNFVLYPSSELYKKYITNTPVIISSIFVGLIFFTSLTVMIYDYCVTVRDKKLLNEAMQSKVKLNDMLMNELEGKRNFIRYISHEVRTPLNIVAMGLKYVHRELRRSKLAKQDWVELVGELDHSNESAVEILDNLLQYEHFTAHNVDLYRARMPIKTYIEDCMRPFYMQAKDAFVTLSLRFHGIDDDSPWLLDIDKRKINHVIRSLLTNAIKFTWKHGEVLVRVSILHKPQQKPSRLPQMSYSENAFAADHFLVIDVVDYGYGIAEEDQKRLFNEIVQFTPTDLQDGRESGLSLWISNQIINLHKGRLYMHSDGLGHGSTFTVELPLVHKETATRAVKTKLTPKEKIGHALIAQAKSIRHIISKRDPHSSSSITSLWQKGINTSPPRTPNTPKDKSIFCLKFSLVFILAGVAAAIGSISYTVLSRDEYASFDRVFRSSVHKISDTIDRNLQSKLLASKVMGDIFAYAIDNGYVGDMPNVTLPGYETIVNYVGNLADIRNIAFAPILTNKTRHGWESYANTHVQDLNGPVSLSRSMNGSWPVSKGCWSRGSNRTYSKGHIPDSLYPDYVIPIWQINHIQDYWNVVMLDIHSEIESTGVLDRVISTKRPGFTDIIQLVEDFHLRPSTILYSPIMTLDKNEVIGIMDVTFSWDIVLKNALPSYISGIDCVLSTSTQTYTMRIESGTVSVIGSDDYHDHRYDDYRQYITASLKSLSSISASDYTLTIYPTSALYHKYVTKTPVIVCGAFVAMIVFTAIIVMMYDYYVSRRERELLEEAVESKARLTDMAMNELASKKSFVRNIAHEVRIPLNIVAIGLKYFSEELKRSKASFSDWAEVMEELAVSNDSAINLLDNLLMYEKLASKTVVITPVRVVVKDYLDDFLKVYFDTERTKDNRNKLILTFTDPTDSPSCFIEVDKRKIDRVLKNIISNAIKFTPDEGEVRVQLSIIAKRAIQILENTNVSGVKNLSARISGVQTQAAYNPMIRIQITDLGPGISQENQERLFKDIIQFTAGELQDGKGSGLSLWISYQLVQLHEGLLSMSSDGLGCGCTFTIDLPLCRSAGIGKQWKQPDGFENLGVEIVPGTGFYGDDVRPYTDDVNRSRPNTNNIQHAMESGRIRSGLSAKDQRSLRQKLSTKNFISNSTKNFMSSTSPIKQSSKRIAAAKELVEVDFSAAALKGKEVDIVGAAVPLSPQEISTNLNKYKKMNTASDSHSDDITTVTDVKKKKSTRRLSSNLMDDMKIHDPTDILFPHAKLLVVDDILMNRKMMIRVIRERWSDIHEAADGLLAVEAVRERLHTENQFDLILMDYQMPNMNGPEAAKIMREEGYSGIIIGVTGNGLPADITYFMDHGADAVLIKPLKTKLLEDCLQDLQKRTPSDRKKLRGSENGR